MPEPPRSLDRTLRYRCPLKPSVRTIRTAVQYNDRKLSYPCSTRSFIPAYAASMSLISAAAFVGVPGLSFACRINLPVPCSKCAGPGSPALRKNPTFTCEVNTLTCPKVASPRHATGQPSCKSSRTSSPHPRITSNHSCAMALQFTPCSFIHVSMAGSRSTAPLNRRNYVFIETPLFAFNLDNFPLLDWLAVTECQLPRAPKANSRRKFP